VVLRLLPNPPLAAFGADASPSPRRPSKTKGASDDVSRYETRVNDIAGPGSKPWVDRMVEHAGPLYNLARYLTGQPEAAEDLVQETFIRALRAQPKLEREADLKPWLFRVLRNAFHDLYRRERRHRTDIGLEEDLPAPGPFADGERELELLRNAAARDIAAALASLSDDGRTVLLLDVEGFTETEIGEIMDCPIGTVKSRLMRARVNLRKQLHRYAK
jgi:RNA polymerase sigma-70 factor (ECF subfamily)